jgi:hydroxymethylbilane synthase
MRIGTRASALALAQARWVADAWRQAGTDVEIVEITTLGDRGVALMDKSRWVSELERALLDGRIDVAVHSAKDVPTDLPEGLALVAVPPRADARDVICGADGLEAVPSGAAIGTSSVRRTAQLRAARDDLEIVELRGNVDTRLRKLAEGQAAALVLALAGLERLDRLEAVGAPLDDFVPAAGQGALALEARRDAIDPSVLAAVDDRGTHACLVAERQLVGALGATCNTPVGAHAQLVQGGAIAITGWVGLPDGSAWLRDELAGEPGSVGLRCAERLLAAGAAELLAQAEREVTSAG